MYPQPQSSQLEPMLPQVQSLQHCTCGCQKCCGAQIRPLANIICLDACPVFSSDYAQAHHTVQAHAKIGSGQMSNKHNPTHSLNAEEEKPSDEQQTAFDLLKAAPQRAAAAEVLSKVLRNIVDHPTEAKYRCKPSEFAIRACLTFDDLRQLSDLICVMQTSGRTS